MNFSYIFYYSLFSVINFHHQAFATASNQINKGDRSESASRDQPDVGIWNW